MKLHSENIISAIRSHPAESISGRQLMSVLNLPAAARRILHRQLRELERQGLVRRMRGGRYSLAGSSGTRDGVVQITKTGARIIRNDKGENIRIADRFLAGALDGDTVRFVLLRRDRMNRMNGKVVQIVERSGKPVVAVYQPGRDSGFVLPLGGSGQTLPVSGRAFPEIQPGDWVVVRLVSGKNRSIASAEIVERLGTPEDPSVQVKAVAARFSIPLSFPSPVLAEAEAIPDIIPDAEINQRTDLRLLPFITIDGESARDFDDAVTVEKTSDTFRLYVAIADVSYYVSPDSQLDRCARERGTSVYFPGFCIPMLPEKLSNELCSLKPGVDRLVLTAELEIDTEGVVCSEKFYSAVIRSRARLTYADVQSSLERKVPETDEDNEHLAQLPLMQELARALLVKRRNRGALEMEIPEPEVILDRRGFPETIRYAQRLEAHRIIEEFMLAANEAVARFLAGAEKTLVYRIHEPPERKDIDRLNRYLGELSVPKLVPGPGLAKGFQHMIGSVCGVAEKRVLSQKMLRSLKQARYSIENPGHFGLAAEQYCHFTSPIRRYPDLLIHRTLRLTLSGHGHDPPPEVMARLAEQASARERNAVEAERDVNALHVCQFMEHRIGEISPGMISSVHKFGFFVELDRFPVEGLVHVSSLDDDFYRFDPECDHLIGERSGNIFRVGMRVKISVENVNIMRREIDFILPTRRPDRLRRNSR